MEIKIDTSDPTALYCHYSSQYEAQDAYIQIAGETITASYNAEIGNATSFDVFHGRIHQLSIPNLVTPKSAIQIVEENKEDFEAVIAGADEHWDGSNWKGTLTDEAQAALDRLECTLREIDFTDYEHIEIWHIENLNDQDIIPDDVDLSKLTEDDVAELSERIHKECQVNAGANVAKVIIHGLDAHLEELIETAREEREETPSKKKGHKL